MAGGDSLALTALPGLVSRIHVVSHRCQQLQPNGSNAVFCGLHPTDTQMVPTYTCGQYKHTYSAKIDEKNLSDV